MKYKIKYTDDNGKKNYIYEGHVWNSFKKADEELKALDEHHPDLYSLEMQPEKLNPLVSWLNNEPAVDKR